MSSLPVDLFKEVPASVVVIDTGNYYPRQRDGRIDAIENDMPESQWVAQQLRRPVIKAFNDIYAAHLQNFGLQAGCRSPKFRPPVISTGYGVAFHKQTAIAIADDRYLRTTARHDSLSLPRTS